jgi:hypothetical protein
LSEALLALALTFPNLYLQGYTLVIFLVLLLGMVYDFIIKKKLAFTREERQAKSQLYSEKTTTGSSRGSANVVASAIIVDVLSSRILGKCSLARRLSHILMLWGFVLSALGLLVTDFVSGGTVTLNPTSPLVYLGIPGNLMLLLGSLWYLPQRVNVSHEGDSSLKVVPADAFILNLLIAAVLGIAYGTLSIYGYAAASEAALVGYFAAITVLIVFGPWTKFPHMFYKGGVIILDKVDESKGITPLPTDSDQGGVS